MATPMETDKTAINADERSAAAASAALETLEEEEKGTEEMEDADRDEMGYNDGNCGTEDDELAGEMSKSCPRDLPDTQSNNVSSNHENDTIHVAIPVSGELQAISTDVSDTLKVKDQASYPPIEFEVNTSKSQRTDGTAITIRGPNVDGLLVTVITSLTNSGCSIIEAHSNLVENTDGSKSIELTLVIRPGAGHHNGVLYNNKEEESIRRKIVTLLSRKFSRHASNGGEGAGSRHQATSRYCDRIRRKMEECENERNNNMQQRTESDLEAGSNERQTTERINTDAETGSSLLGSQEIINETDLPSVDLDSIANDAQGDATVVSISEARERTHYDQSIGEETEDESSQTGNIGTPPDEQPYLPNGDDDATRPGAQAASGRAPGQIPAWAERRSDVANESTTELGTEDSLPITAELVEEDVDVEVAVRRRILQEASRACIVDDTAQKKCRRYLIIFVITLSIVLVGTAVGLSMKVKRHGDDVFSNSSVSPTTSPSISITEYTRPTLDTLLDRGEIRCGVGPFKQGSKGFEKDLCRAVAAAVFGNSDLIKIHVVSFAERFETLANGTIDLLALASTHSMDRDVYMLDSKVGFSFTVPYIYEGLAFGGVPTFADCADKLDAFFNDCRGLRICVNKGNRLYPRVTDFFPGYAVVGVPNLDKLFSNFVNGTCNVIAEVRFGLSEKRLKQMGYKGDYKLGKNLFSKEPLSMVTRDDDPQWSDFVNFVVQALFSAEEKGITQKRAANFVTTSVFGDTFESMFVNAISAVGNYAEMYNRHLEEEVPRAGLDFVNNGTTGLIYSHPFGDTLNIGPEPIKDGTLERILNRGHVICGITKRDGFGEFDSDTWSGMDADYCYALSASIFNGETENRIKFVSLTDSEGLRFSRLANHDVDVLLGASVRLVTDVLEPTSREGFSFSQPYFYCDSNTSSRCAKYGKALAVATRQNDRQWSSWVYWIVASTFYAEENVITQQKSTEMPEVKLFGSGFERMFRDAILVVGNYADMYERNLQKVIPRSGRNLLNAIPFGAEHFPLPFE